MGMFDWVKVSVDKLPISDEERALIHLKEVFQTKDFYNQMIEIQIQDDGNLIFDGHQYSFTGAFYFLHDQSAG